MNKSSKSRLATSTLLAGLAGFTVPALAGAILSLSPTDAAAQTVQTVPQNNTTATTDDQGDDEEVVVTGTIFRNNQNSVSPLTVVDTENLEARGISTIQDAIQSLAANGGPALTNSFTANGAFAGGASGVSLRGLSTNSTLVLFDGLRASYYPLADDGSRNFVDLNTIPDDIVERIEVLRDGASSTYGADAIAGVVNIITKREFNGVALRAEGGLSDRGDAASNRVSLTAGWGNLAEDGINAYISAFRYHSDALFNHDRGFPFNTDDLTNLGGGGPNNIVNTADDENPFLSDGVTPNPNFGVALNSTSADFMLRAYTRNPDGSLSAPTGTWVHAAPGCLGGGVSRSLTVAEQGTTNPASLCTYDYTNLYAVIQPNIDRWGVSGRASFNLPSDIRGYVEANFMESTVEYTGFPPTLYNNAPTGINYPRYSTAQQPNTVPFDPASNLLNLPVYVCPAGSATHVCTAGDAGAILNPANPFAASGQVARMIGRDMTQVTENQTRNRTYRIAGGLSGSFENGWDWDLGATAMHTDLRRFTDGYVYIANMLTAINNGTFNPADPQADPGASITWGTQNAWDFMTPSSTTDASSDQVQLQGSLSMPLFELAGGPMQFAIGGSWRYEAVDSPSANDDIFGSTQRYFTLNAFGTTGDRDIRSAFFELDAPVLETLDINLSGRFDDYSSGQTHFSPKIGARFRPWDFLTLRATYSEGFRIPSFGEANALPTTGYVSNSKSMFTDAYLLQYGCDTSNFSTCPVYIRNGSVGETSLATPDLDPEESRSFTAGFIVEPFQNFTIAVDYFDIEKTGAITAPSFAPALQAYYGAGGGAAGVTAAEASGVYHVIPDAQDVSFPLATPRVAFVEANLVNANTVNARGWDFSVNYDRDITDHIRWSSALDLSYISRLSTTFPDGTTERYDGTLGNFNLTSGNGTPSWHGQWVNTFNVGMFDLTASVNWYDGYNLSAMDQGTGYKDCGLNPGYSPTGCNVDDAITYDLNGQAHLNDNVTLYLSVLNVTDEMPPVDVVTYGAYNYNAVQGMDMILGRYFRAGVRLNF